jgi:GWxTD domain-containing protein
MAVTTLVMKKCITLVLILLTIRGVSQPLRDINYNYLYNPAESFSFTLKPVRLSDSWKIIFALEVKDTSVHDAFSIQWQAREGLIDKDGALLSSFVDQTESASPGLTGSLTIPFADAPKIVVAKVTNNTLKKAWMYYQTLESNYPVNNYLYKSDGPAKNAYVYAADTLRLAQTERPVTVSFYNDIFPAAAPAFSEGQAKVARTVKADSVFIVQGKAKLKFNEKGLYLLQYDTLASEGLTVRVESDYPRFRLVQNLPGPLIYICTKQEYDKLQQAKVDKKAFDRTVLGITGDMERAVNLVRSYFRRVELANRYFTSYKEGWKTDRGMIYIIFGLPDEVFKFYDREVWKYKNNAFDISFDFAKSPSLFDPDNYVLIRDNKYKDTWYEVIDLWRNARF